MKLLKLRSLPDQWIDKDQLILHAAFQLLQDFVEREKAERIAWNHDSRSAKAWREIRSLYRWWKKIRPDRRSPLDARGLKKPPMRFKPRSVALRAFLYVQEEGEGLRIIGIGEVLHPLPENARRVELFTPSASPAHDPDRLALLQAFMRFGLKQVAGRFALVNPAVVVRGAGNLSAVFNGYERGLLTSALEGTGAARNVAFA